MGKVTEKRELFCHEYLIDLNATAAAVRSGFSEKTAAQQGYQLLRDPDVKKRIDELRARNAAEIGITPAMVILHLWEIASFDPGCIYDEKGELKNIHDMPANARRNIASVEVLEVEEFNQSSRQMEKVGEIKKVKRWDRQKALDSLGRHLAMFTDKTKHELGPTLEQLLAGTYAAKKPGEK